MKIGYYMKMPSRCPICNEPLLNEYMSDKTVGVILLSKKCDKMISHRIDFLSEEDHNEVHYVSMSLPPKLRAVWFMNNRTLELRQNGAKQNFMNLPWVDPDFSNYQKLVTKLKTYAIFS